LFRALAWWWACGIFSRQWLVRYAELFGIPFRIARHEPGADDDEKWAIMKALEEMGNAGVAVVPKGTEMELLESVKSASENPQTVLLDRRDRSADILILGQTLTTDVGNSGSRALGDVHKNIRMDRLVEVAEWTSEVVNDSIIPAILQLNYGNTDECPKMRLEIPETGSPLEKIQRDQIFTSIAPMPKRQFYARHSVAIPDKDEETVMQLSPPAPSFSGTSAGGSRMLQFEATGGGVPPDNNQLLDAAISEVAGVNAQWLAPLRPRIGALFALAANDETSEEKFQAALDQLIEDVPGLFDKLDKEALASHLEEIQGAAAINGAMSRLQKTKGALKALEVSSG